MRETRTDVYVCMMEDLSLLDEKTRWTEAALSHTFSRSTHARGHKSIANQWAVVNTMCEGARKRQLILLVLRKLLAQSIRPLSLPPISLSSRVRNIFSAFSEQ